MSSPALPTVVSFSFPICELVHNCHRSCPAIVCPDSKSCFLMRGDNIPSAMELIVDGKVRLRGLRT